MYFARKGYSHQKVREFFVAKSLPLKAGLSKQTRCATAIKIRSTHLNAGFIRIPAPYPDSLTSGEPSSSASQRLDGCSSQKVRRAIVIGTPMKAPNMPHM